LKVTTFIHGDEIFFIGTASCLIFKLEEKKTSDEIAGFQKLLSYNPGEILAARSQFWQLN
jgi:hypothetical protein